MSKVVKNLPTTVAEFYSGSWKDTSVEDKLERLRHEMKKVQYQIRWAKCDEYTIDMDIDNWI